MINQKSFIEKIITYAKKNKLWDKGDRILAAVSGGPDSLALLLALHQMAEKEEITVGCCCVNHHLREAAGKEAEFVRVVCSELKVEFFLKEVDVYKKIQTGGSLETAARELRYEALREAKNEGKYDKIAIAHHGNDQVETILYHMIKGSGLTGLSGMKEKNGDLIRPFLRVGKQEILSFLKTFPYQACHDETNDVPDAVRNKIRLELIPALKEYNPGVEQSILRMGSILREDDLFLEEETKNFIKENVIAAQGTYIFSVKRFLDLSLSLKRRVLREVCFRVSKRTPGFEGVEKFIHLITYGKTGHMSSSSGNIIRLVYGQVHIQKGDTHYGPERTGISSSIDFTDIHLPNTDIINSISGTKEKWIMRIDEYACRPEKIFRNQLLLDGERVGRLVLRNKKEGDIFSPRGAEGSKKLTRVMQDLHIPSTKRKNWPLVADENHIYWISFLRGSRFGNPNETTRKYLLITLERTP